MAGRIRKQVNELSAADFDAHPCWEYASNEEHRKGQDECTVRPLDPARLEQQEYQEYGNQVFVQAVFFFPDGRVRLGSITLNAGDDPSGHQPVIFLDKETLSFYSGGSKPSQAEERRFRRALKSICPDPFPIRYVTSLQTAEGRPLAFGELRGLYWLDWRIDKLNVV